MASVLQNDASAGRGLRTFIQAIIGFVVGLALVVWQVDGVPQAVYNYITTNLGGFLLLVGVPAGVTGGISYVWNRLRGVPAT